MTPNSRRPASVGSSETCGELLEGKMRPCCWAGCIHRTDKDPSRWQQAVLIDRKKKTSSKRSIISDFTPRRTPASETPGTFASARSERSVCYRSCPRCGKGLRSPSLALRPPRVRASQPILGDTNRPRCTKLRRDRGQGLEASRNAVRRGPIERRAGSTFFM